MRTAAFCGGRLRKRFLNGLLFRALAVSALSAVVGFGQSANFTVSGNSGPWVYAVGGLNGQYLYGLNDQAAPTIINSESGYSFAAGASLIVTYVSGTVNTSGGQCPGSNCYDANGFGVINGSPGPSGTYLPSFYIPPAEYPVNVGELVGIFTDANGAIVGSPQAIGDGPTMLTVPAGASQLQLGINDDKYSDNNGSFTVQVTQPPAPDLIPNPMTLSFNYVLNGATPASQNVTLSSSDNTTPLDFTVSSNVNWLTAAPLSGNTPATLVVTVNPSGLAANVYHGVITLNSNLADNTPFLVAVTLTITSEPELLPSTTVLTFNALTNGPAPPAQAVNLTSSDVTLPLTFSATGNFPWLTVTTGNGTTPGAVTVTVNPAGLAPDTYTGTVTITSPNATNGSISILVTFNITNPPALMPSTRALTFNYVQNGATPPSQTVSLTSSDNVTVLNFTATTNFPWLTVTTGNGTTPGAVTVTVNPSGLPPDTYTGMVTITSPNAANSSTSILVTFNITTLPTLVASTRVLTFNYELNGIAPPTQTVSLTSSDNATVLNFTATTNFPWLTANTGSGTSPGAVTVTVNPSGLPPNSYTGTVTIVSPNAVNGSISVLVTFNVTNPPTLVASARALTFTYVLNGTAPPNQTVNLTSSDNVTVLNFTATTNFPWLTANAGSGTTPGAVTVAVNPSGLPPDTYTGTVKLTSESAGSSPMYILVTFNITTEPTLVSSPRVLTFTYLQGGTKPAAQTVSVTSSDNVTPLNVIATANSAWLTATLANGTTPGTLTVAVDPTGLSPDSYTGTITLTSANASNGTVSILVTLTISVEPSALSFTFNAGLPPPLPQPIPVDPGIPGVAFTATTSGESWLALSTLSGAAPSTISVSVNASNLAPSPSPYMSTITISFDGVAPTQTISVTLFVPPPGTLLLPPQSLSFSSIPAGTVGTQTFTLASSNDGSIPFQITVDPQGLPISASNPPLTVSPLGGATPALITVSVDPTTLAPGRTYHPTLTFTSSGATVTQPLTITTPSLAQPSLAVAPTLVQMEVQPGSSVASQIAIQDLNGSGTASYNVTVGSFNPLLNGSAPWLSVAQPAGSVTGAIPSSVPITIDVTNLAAGVYTATLHVALGPLGADIPVAITVPAPTLKMQLGSLGATFFVRQGQGTSLTQQIPVVDLSDESFPVTATVDTVGQRYITVTPSAMAAQGAPGILTVAVNPDFASSSAPGSYYANVTISSPQVVNSPQTFVVLIQVQSAAIVAVQPTPVPSGLVFVSEAAASALPQSFRVFASSIAPVSFQAAPQTYSGPDIDAGTPVNWLYVLSTTGTASTSVPATVQIAVSTSALTAGIYTGGITVAMAGSLRVVHITLIVPPASSVPQQRSASVGRGRGKAAPASASPCVRSSLVPTFIGGLPGGYANAQGGPDTISVQVNDNCGALVPDPNNPSDPPAVVTLGFSAGDPPQAHMMQNGNPGQYAFPWTPDVSGTVVVSVTADPGTTLAGVISGFSNTTGETDSSPGPVLKTNGVINNFDPATGAPLAPGTIVQIYGTNFLPPGTGLVQNTSLTFNAPVAGVSVVIGGSPAYVYYVAPYGSASQVSGGPSVIGAQIPTQLAGTDYQIQVSVTDSSTNLIAYTLANSISLAPATPGAVYGGEIFAQNYPSPSLVTAANPAIPGTFVILYVDGLGATTPLIPTGMETSGAPTANTAVQVYLDGQPIPNTYAGLTPSLVGLYQVNFQVPTGMTPGAHSIYITQGNRTSGTGTLYLGSASTP